MKKLSFLICFLLLTAVISCQSKRKRSNNQLADNSINENSIKKIENYLSRLETEGFSGAVIFAKGNEVLIDKGYGYSDRQNQIKNSSKTVFDIGSVTKQFTAAGILKLEMQGKLSVKDKLSKYFVNVPNDKKNITIHQMLTHSAGLLPAIGDDYESISEDEFIKRAFKQKLLFIPGSAYEYSNVGYSLLGIIIEKVSGETYENYLYQNLWKPADMQQTGYTRPDFLDANVAIGYNKKGEALGRPHKQPWAKDAPFWHLKANGGILSTAIDMYKWHQALNKDDILSAQAKKNYFTPYIQEGEGAPSYYGYGWAMYKTSRDTRLAAHNGGNGIFFADFWRYLDDDMAIILLNNNATPYSEIIASQIGALYILPDFQPTYPDEKDMGGEGVEDEAVENLVKSIVAVLNKDDENAWKNFIEKTGSDDFISMAPMELHLKYFTKFHNKLKGGQVVTLEIDGDEAIAGVKTANGIETLVLNFSIAKNGALKFGGMMIE